MNNKTLKKNLIDSQYKNPNVGRRPIIGTNSNTLKKVIKINTKKTSQVKIHGALNMYINDAPKTFIITLENLASKIGAKDLIRKQITEITDFHNCLIKNHSVVEGTARYNTIRNYAITLLEGGKPEPLS